MLEVRGLDAFYGDSHILHGVSLDLGPGGVALLGRNGAGKTTLLKSIMNAGPRCRGEIRLDGRDLGATPPFRRARGGIALVPEDRRIYAHLTVRENLELARHAAPEPLPPGRVDEVVAMFPLLGALMARYGDQLSGGQQQILAVARAFVPRPRIILLDEPTEGIAPIIVDQMAENIGAACEKDGVMLLLTEQNLRFARAVTGRLYLLDSGRMVFEGGWAELDREPALKSRYLAV